MPRCAEAGIPAPEWLLLLKMPLAVAATLLAALVSQAHFVMASELIATEGTKLEVALGATYATDARFLGILIQPKLQPAIEIEYEHGPYFASSDRGIGLKDGEEGKFSVGLGANYQSGRKESEDRRYRGLGDVPGSIEAHAFFEWLPVGSALTLYGDVGSAASGAARTLYSAGARVAFPLASALSGFVDASLTGGNDRYVKAFYGVSPEQAATSHYPVYTPRSGVFELASVVGAAYNVAPKCSIVVSVGPTRRVGDVAASPLIDHRSYPAALIVSSYRF